MLNTTYNVHLSKDAKFAWINFTQMIMNISSTISEVLYNKTVIVKNLSDLVERAFNTYANNSDQVINSTKHVYYDSKSPKSFCDVYDDYNKKLNPKLLLASSPPATTNANANAASSKRKKRSSSIMRMVKQQQSAEMQQQQQLFSMAEQEIPSWPLFLEPFLPVNNNNNNNNTDTDTVTVDGGELLVRSKRRQQSTWPNATSQPIGLVIKFKYYIENNVKKNRQIVFEFFFQKEKC